MKSKCLIFVLSDSTYFFFFFNDPPTTEIYTLSLHDALPISLAGEHDFVRLPDQPAQHAHEEHTGVDRKSTRLNSSHRTISYAVFCLKKKKKYFTCNTLLTS